MYYTDDHGPNQGPRDHPYAATLSEVRAAARQIQLPAIEGDAQSKFLREASGVFMAALVARALEVSP